jgi:SAM-dependent methyltransferase
MTSSTQQDSPYIGPKFGGFAIRLSWYARQKMLKTLLKVAPISASTSVVDVGVTSDQRQDCNFFEKLYPYPDRITAVGTEDASFLEQECPGLKFIQTNGSGLPFRDQSFDLAVTFAVVEHVGDRRQQKAFIRELCRVGKTCFITTPNRWFPIEFHTGLPLIHWLPPRIFRTILRWIGKDFWAEEANLNLLTEKDVLSMFPADAKVTRSHFKLLGMTSNLVFYVENSL